MTKSRPDVTTPRRCADRVSLCPVRTTAILVFSSSEPPERAKTSLLRQLIGSDPDEDRFPSTAPAKTTIADIEVIQRDGDFDAAVTFFSEFQAQANIEECIIDAALAVLEKAPLDKVADRFLSHRDQKFRLSYILGNWRTNSVDEQDEMSFDETE